MAWPMIVGCTSSHVSAPIASTTATSPPVPASGPSTAPLQGSDVLWLIASMESGELRLLSLDTTTLRFTDNRPLAAVPSEYRRGRSAAFNNVSFFAESAELRCDAKPIRSDPAQPKWAGSPRGNGPDRFRSGDHLDGHAGPRPWGRSWQLSHLTRG
jgi:hypothetical protein